MIQKLRKTKSSPTLADRYHGAVATRGAALSVFDGVVDDLLRAEAELHEIASDAQDQIDARQDAHEAELDRLQNLHYGAITGLAEMRDLASDDAAEVAVRADRVRFLL